MNSIRSLRYSINVFRIIIFCAMILPRVAFPSSGPPGTVPLEPARPPITRAFNDPPVGRERRMVLTQGDFSYENATISEDVTWRGTVLIRGFLVIAPQATLRIEPGTVVRFMKSAILRQPPRLVVQGRIQCNGTTDSPILFAPNLADAVRGDWGGILLLSSEKRNQLENCRIEGAEKGLEARFSKLTAKDLLIKDSGTGMLLRDSTATLSAMIFGACDTGLEAHDSEVELREGALTDNRRGIAVYNSSLVLMSVAVKGSEQLGIVAEECRIKISLCELSGNGTGALLKGGEGQVQLCRFVRNREIGLHMSGARIKVQRSLFADNIRDAIRMDDGRGGVWGSAFSGNGGFNLVNAGREEINAVLNWWGSNDETAILSKLFDAEKKDGTGIVAVSPWLPEKPVALP